MPHLAQWLTPDNDEDLYFGEAVVLSSSFWQLSESSQANTADQRLDQKP